jgi:hypothetical protein
MADNVVVLKWIILGICLMLGLAIAALLFLPISISGRWGFIGPKSNDVVHHTDDAGLVKVMQRLMKGDLYDMVGVSRVNDEYAGVIVYLEAGTPVLSVSFYTASQQQELASFRRAMSEFGYELSEDSNSFNGGTSEANRTTMLEYELPKDAAKISAFTNAALSQLQSELTDGFYLTASLLAHGPSGAGIKFHRPEDPLSNVL